MSVLRKYYKSLKQATDYLENVKQLYNRQVDAYEAFSDRIEDLPYGEDESLNDCHVELKKENIFRFLYLLSIYALDNCLLGIICFAIETSWGLVIPLFIPVFAAIFVFMLFNGNWIRDFDQVSRMKKRIMDANTLLGNEKAKSNLKDLMMELADNIKCNEEYINELSQAIDEYMSLLLEQENKLLPYGPQEFSKDEIVLLEEGLKKLNLSYREENKV